MTQPKMTYREYKDFRTVLKNQAFTYLYGSGLTSIAEHERIQKAEAYIKALRDLDTEWKNQK